MNTLEIIAASWAALAALQLTFGAIAYMAETHRDDQKTGARLIILAPLAPLMTVLWISRGIAAIWRAADFKNRNTK